MNVYPNQQLVFDLGAIATENSGETPSCIVRNPLTGHIANVFNSCNVTSLNNLILKPKDSINGNFTLELGFLKVPSTSDSNITLQLISLDGVTTIGDTSEIPLPPTNAPRLMNPNNVVYTRLYSNPGDVSEVSFVIRPSRQAISMTTQIYVYFPNYYSDKLGYRNIWCTANDLPLACLIMRSRILHFATFPREIPVGNSVTIKIYGIMTPIVPVPVGSIFIGIDDDHDTSQLVEYIEIKDLASIPYQNNPLPIHAFVASTKIIREKADYSISFITDLSGVKTNTIISIDFPDRFGNTLRGQQGPTVLISRTGSEASIEVHTISFGSRFKIILPIDLDPITSYTLTIKGIANPDYQTCNMDKPTLIIASKDQSAAVVRTVPALWDGELIDYLQNPKLKTLILTDVNGTILTNLTLSTGTFSQEIRIAPPNGEAFNSEIAFSTTENRVNLLPSILTGKRGASYLSFRVGVPIDFSPQTVLITFEQDESSIYQIYSPLPHLEVTLVNNKKNILPTPPINIMRGGTSIPYVWLLDKMGLVPFTGLQISALINDAEDSPLSFVGSSVVLFDQTAPQGGFTFALASDADPNTPPSFSLSLSGRDLPSYQLENSEITVTVIDPIEAAPTLNKLLIPNNYAPTRQEVIINIDQSASVYWYIVYQNKLSTTDCQVIRDIYHSGVQFDALSDTQDQYGVLYVYNENEDHRFEIDNLVSNQAYSFILCLVNQMDAISSVSGSFSTMNNQASLSLLTLNFDGPINRNQLTSVVCLFNRDLQLDNLE